MKFHKVSLAMFSVFFSYCGVVSAESSTMLDPVQMIGDFSSSSPGLEQAVISFRRVDGGTYVRFDVYSVGTTTKIFSTKEKYYDYMNCDEAQFTETPYMNRSNTTLVLGFKMYCNQDGAQFKHGTFIYVADLATPTSTWAYEYQLGGGTELLGAGFVPDVDGDGVQDVVINRLNEANDGSMQMVSIIKNGKTGATISSKPYRMDR